MIQATTFPQRARLPLVAVAAFGLGVLATLSAPHISIGTATISAPVILQAPTLPPNTSARHTESGKCGDGAYVTGDMVGDANPADVYATLCGR